MAKSKKSKKKNKKSGGKKYARSTRKGGGKQGGRRDGVFVRLGGLWKRKTKKGDRMYSGLVSVAALRDWFDEIGFEDRKSKTNVPVILLVNSYKEESKHPDMNIFGTDPDQQRGGKYKKRDQDDDDEDEDEDEDEDDEDQNSLDEDDDDEDEDEDEDDD